LATALFSIKLSRVVTVYKSGHNLKAGVAQRTPAASAQNPTKASDTTPTPLSESELTLRLGASRTPIRQALQHLEQKGFVVAHRHGAITRLSVAPMTVDDMKELHAIFGALEGLAARSAAQLQDPAR
jgi:DNA-binding FadR family transcriptional regulator